MIKRIFLAIFLPLLMLALTIPVFAQGGRPIPQSNDVVDLSEEQLVQVQELRIAFQNEILPKRIEINTGYMELDNLYMQNADQETIDAKGSALEMLEMELDKAYDTHQQQIRALLTDKQKVIFDQFGGLGMGVGLGGGYGLGYGAGNAAALGRGRGMNRAGAWNRGRGAGTGYGRVNPRAYTRGVNRGIAYNRGLAFNRGIGRANTRAVNRYAGRGFAQGVGRGLGRAPFCRRWWIR
jgi:hypothetical protein